MRKKELTLSKEPIKFSDPEIKRRCIKAGWDLDGDGEISYAEAAKVKDIRGIFSENHIGRYYQGVARIITFDEFQYFTGIEIIPEYAFAECINLRKISIPKSVRYIEKCAFVSSGLENIDIPDTVVSIKNMAFLECKNLRNARIFSRINKIENGSFCGCSSLKYVRIPDTIETIGESAFAGCGFESFRFSNNLRIIEKLSFSGCGLKELRLPESIEIVSEYAFFSCKSLETLIIPMNHIDFGQCSFAGCNKLTNVRMEISRLVNELVQKSVFNTPRDISCPIYQNYIKRNKDFRHLHFENYTHKEIEDMYREAFEGNASNEWNID